MIKEGDFWTVKKFFTVQNEGNRKFCKIFEKRLNLIHIYDTIQMFAKNVMKYINNI